MKNCRNLNLKAWRKTKQNNMEQTIDLSELRKLLPERAKIEFKKKKGQTGTSLEVSVKIVPYLTHEEHESTVKSIIELFGEDLLEVYTETTGYHFYVYLRMSSTQPTTIEILRV